MVLFICQAWHQGTMGKEGKHVNIYIIYKYIYRWNAAAKCCSMGLGFGNWMIRLERFVLWVVDRIVCWIATNWLSFILIICSYWSYRPELCGNLHGEEWIKDREAVANSWELPLGMMSLPSVLA